jgi:arylsulfatase A
MGFVLFSVPEKNILYSIKSVAICEICGKKYNPNHFNLCLVTAVQLRNAQTKSKQPNIIFIIADDLGYADLGCYGQQKTETPNIDQLAKKGMRFTQFYAGTSVCAPSRTSFMTGLHTGHTPIRGNKSFDPEGQTPLPTAL